MTTTTGHKRLNGIESHLTPTEWAIRLADESRKFPNVLAYTKSLAKVPLDELPVQRPYFAFEEQAGERHPGRKPEDISARERLIDRLWNEFHTLKVLIREVNLAMQCKVESVGLQAALRLSALHSLILQDAFAQMATQTAVLLTTQNQPRANSKRQKVLKLLAAFTDADMHEKLPDRVLLQDALSRYPAPLEEWHHEFTALLKDFFAHLAAVEMVQRQHFDGHPILFLDLEAALTKTARTIESAVVTANEYLKRRAGKNRETCEDYHAIALESIKANAKGQWAAAIAEKWLKAAKFEAIEEAAEQWEQWRAEFGVR